MINAMKSTIKIVMAIGGSLMLAGCSAQEDRFASGVWELQTWMEVAGRSDRFEQRSMNGKLSPSLAEAGVRAGMFFQFYRGL